MPRPTWTTDEQLAFLSERKKGFTDSQAKNTSRAFLNSTAEDFLELWPVEPPTAAEVFEEDGDVETAKKVKLQKAKKRIEHWFRNHTRANATGATNARTAVLSLAPKKTQPLLAYQAYMCLYRERVMLQIKEDYDAYKAQLPKGEKARRWWSFAIEDANRLLKGETDDVKEQVEKHRTRTVEKLKPAFIPIGELEKMETEDAASKVYALQQAINLLPRTGQEALKAIEAQTGFHGVLLIGGPNPETGRLVTLAIHNGRTLQLKNLFSEAAEQWPTIQTAFDTFIARCFPPDLPAKLEQYLRGTMPSPSSQSVTPKSSSAPSASSPSSKNTTASSSATSSADPGREDTPELDYDQERQKTIARNTIIMKRLAAGESMADIMESIDKERPEDEEPEWLSDALPEWVEEALEYLREASEESWWGALLDEWVEFERRLGFPDGQNSRVWLPTKGRPEEVKYWIGRGRPYNKPPRVKSVAAFVAGWRKWWANLQPAVRQPAKGGSNWPLSREIPNDGDSDAWARLKRGGRNGLFMVIVCLWWWLDALEEGADLADVREAANDVKWVCVAMTDPARLTGGPSPTPEMPEERSSGAPEATNSDADASPPFLSLSSTPSSSSSSPELASAATTTAPTTAPSAMMSPVSPAATAASTPAATSPTIASPATTSAATTTSEVPPTLPVSPAIALPAAPSSEVASPAVTPPTILAGQTAAPAIASLVVLGGESMPLPSASPSPPALVSPLAPNATSALSPTPASLGVSTPVADVSVKPDVVMADATSLTEAGEVAARCSTSTPPYQLSHVSPSALAAKRPSSDPVGEMSEPAGKKSRVD